MEMLTSVPAADILDLLTFGVLSLVPLDDGQANFLAQCIKVEYLVKRKRTSSDAHMRGIEHIHYGDPAREEAQVYQVRLQRS